MRVLDASASSIRRREQYAALSTEQKAARKQRCAKYYQDKKSAFANHHRQYSSTIRGCYSHFKSSAKSRNIFFNITFEEFELAVEKSGMQCCFSGLQLTFDVNSRHKLSLDRIDSEGSYTIDNIQIVSQQVNKMKNDLTQVEFLNLVMSIEAHRSKQLHKA